MGERTENLTVAPDSRTASFIRHSIPDFNTMAGTYFNITVSEVGKGQRFRTPAAHLPPRKLYEVHTTTQAPGFQVAEQVEKDGGRLFYREGVIINEFETHKYAQLWTEIALGLPDISTLDRPAGPEIVFIPVAPVLLNSEGRPRIVRGKSGTRVFSRFCGLSQSQITVELAKIDGKIGQSYEALFLRHRMNILSESIVRKRQEIAGMFHQLGIDYTWYSSMGHNHDRPDNYTVEFIEKDAHAKYYKDQIGLNTRYHPPEISFDLQEYLLNPERFEVVVRAIDLSMVTLTQTNLPKIVRAASLSTDSIRKFLESDSYYLRHVGFHATTESNVPALSETLEKNISSYIEQDGSFVLDTMIRAGLLKKPSFRQRVKEILESEEKIDIRDVHRVKDLLIYFLERADEPVPPETYQLLREGKSLRGLFDFLDSDPS